jgi:hypothetical protein
MKHLRKDYDDFALLDAKIPHDEPVFLLRGQDPSSAPAVREWAADAEDRGADPELCERVLDWADQMELYAALHGKPVADVPDGAMR